MSIQMPEQKEVSYKIPAWLQERLNEYPDQMTIKQVGEILKKPVATVQRWTEEFLPSGKPNKNPIPSYHLGPRSKYITKEDLCQWFIEINTKRKGGGR